MLNKWSWVTDTVSGITHPVSCQKDALQCKRDIKNIVRLGSAAATPAPAGAGGGRVT